MRKQCKVSVCGGVCRQAQRQGDRREMTWHGAGQEQWKWRSRYSMYFKGESRSLENRLGMLCDRKRSIEVFTLSNYWKDSFHLLRKTRLQKNQVLDRRISVWFSRRWYVSRGPAKQTVSRTGLGSREEACARFGSHRQLEFWSNGTGWDHQGSEGRWEETRSEDWVLGMPMFRGQEDEEESAKEEKKQESRVS